MGKTMNTENWTEYCSWCSPSQSVHEGRWIIWLAVLLYCAMCMSFPTGRSSSDALELKNGLATSYPWLACIFFFFLIAVFRNKRNLELISLVSLELWMMWNVLTLKIVLQYVGWKLSISGDYIIWNKSNFVTYMQLIISELSFVVLLMFTLQDLLELVW